MQFSLDCHDGKICCVGKRERIGDRLHCFGKDVEWYYSTRKNNKYDRNKFKQTPRVFKPKSTQTQVHLKSERYEKSKDCDDYRHANSNGIVGKADVGPEKKSKDNK